MIAFRISDVGRGEGKDPRGLTSLTTRATLETEGRQTELPLIDMESLPHRISAIPSLRQDLSLERNDTPVHPLFVFLRGEHPLERCEQNELRWEEDDFSRKTYHLSEHNLGLLSARYHARS